MLHIKETLQTIAKLLGDTIKALWIQYLVFLLGGASAIYLWTTNQWLSFVQAITQGTPIWATSILAVVSVGYTYIKFRSCKTPKSKEIIPVVAWDQDRTQYEPIHTQNGSSVYAPKQGTEAFDHYHWLCPSCFNKEQISFLQPYSYMTTVFMKCTICKNTNIVLQDGERARLQIPPSRAY